MEKDKVLQRLELENRKEVLKATKNKIKKEGIEVVTHRGVYKVEDTLVLYYIKQYINSEIQGIDKQIEELTGLNQNKMERLYEV